MFENVERIAAPARDVFIREFALARRPVILTGLFEGEPIRRLSTLEAARAALGGMAMSILEPYDQHFARVVRGMLSGAPFDPLQQQQESTLAGYLDRVEADPRTRDICGEVPTRMMPELAALYSPPAYCRTAAGGMDPDYQDEVWLGNAGNHSHLHFDLDQRNILQYQIFGAKRVILIPPGASSKLGPIRNNCTISPEGVPDEDKDAFVRFTGGYQCVVRAGEALFMPALIWHYFEYVETSMALTLRFLRNGYNRFLATRLHGDPHVQALGWRLVNEAAIEPRVEEAYRQVEEAYRRGCPDPLEKGRQLQALLEAIHARLEGGRPGTYTRPFLGELTAAVRGLEIQARGLYREAEG